ERTRVFRHCDAGTSDRLRLPPCPAWPLREASGAKPMRSVFQFFLKARLGNVTLRLDDLARTARLRLASPRPLFVKAVLLRPLLLRPLGSIFRAALLAVLHALRVEHAAQDVIAHARQVLDAPAADHHHRVLLQVMALTGNVTDDLEAVRQPYLGDLAQRRVRLLRRRRVDARAHAPFLGAGIERGSLVPIGLRLPGLPDQLRNRRHDRLPSQRRKRRKAKRTIRRSGHQVRLPNAEDRVAPIMPSSIVSIADGQCLDALASGARRARTGEVHDLPKTLCRLSRPRRQTSTGKWGGALPFSSRIEMRESKEARAVP